jgi:hypothetical protein
MICTQITPCGAGAEAGTHQKTIKKGQEKGTRFNKKRRKYKQQLI